MLRRDLGAGGIGTEEAGPRTGGGSIDFDHGTETSGLRKSDIALWKFDACDDGMLGMGGFIIDDGTAMDGLPCVST